ncbi:sam and ph domain-containing protein [Ophiostoma piceae UAMH 11346]|uniref:Sam and ph domain-containing protein n=1 Tax=Ophiostoma piceae (strain UAMH 11346) TaxID=1262450 RepID=S3C2T3_OPHP1|nr:sam and ph domain-containing protein [Ophiostoma piceae UAMH 11346]
MQSQMIATARRPAMEMQQKNPLMLHDSFFSLKGVQDRPVSVATEFMESDFEDDEIMSDYDDGDNSPRASLNSGQPSFTTISSYDEVPTPRSSQVPMAVSMSMSMAMPTEIEMAKPVEGPRGPHLFRISNLSADFENALSLSPITPKVHHSQQAQYAQYAQYAQHTEYAEYSQYPPALPHGITPLPPTPRRNSGPFAFTHDELDTRTLAAWSPEHVAQWMLNAGIELQVCERFVENDITGSILITLKFEDLKELGIPSFGIRTNVWTQINTMKNVKPAADEPRPDTPIEDAPDREVRREVRHELRRMNSCATPTMGPTKSTLRRGPSVRRLQNQNQNQNRAADDITPLESVSIVGIEQVMPKPHQCSKGKDCSKWRRQQRMIESFKREHPFADMDKLDKGGIIMIAGDPGNPQTARSINPSDDEVFRPISDAMPSVVASSDVMGPAFPPVPVALEEESLRALQSRDPQDNVRQFLSFQHQHLGTATSSEVPPTPPFELFPARQQATERLRALPKLAIPAQKQSPSQTQKRHSHGSTPNANANTQPMSAHPMSAHPSLGSANNAYPLSSKTVSAAPTSSTSYTYTAIEESPGRTPTAPYRFGTPFTEVDVPITAVPVGPVAREVSQSVPPDMNYRAAPQRTMSRASARRPSFPVLPSLHENRVAAAAANVQAMPMGQQRAASAMGHRPTYQSGSPTLPQGFAQGAQAAPAGPRQLQAPPRHVYPWSPAQKSFEKAIAPLSLITSTLSSSSKASSLASAGSGSASSSGSAATPASSVQSGTVGTVGTVYPDGVSYQGEVKKRKTKMLRHEWNDRFVTLKGTRLAVHKDRSNVGRTLEYVDIDDYAIACSTMAASTSKLNAAFKAMNIRRGSGDGLSGAGSKDDVSAFAFQLIPQDSKGGVRLKKRDSAMPATEACFASPTDASSGPAIPGPADASNGTGKTHHFAVKSRDDRIEWMRELMLAKAMRQKVAGFEVSVNGNMI